MYARFICALNRKSFPQQSHLYERGVTLIELLIVLAIFSISFATVGPNIQRFIASNRITAQLNHISGVIQRARHQAIHNQDTVLLCPSHNFVVCSQNWNHPIIGFIDTNRNLEKDQDERLLIASQAILPTERLSGPRGPIRFHESGQNSSAATLLLCPKNGDATLARALFVSIQGRVRLSVDSDQDGIHERSKSKNIVCSISS